ncbi:hypothetical protein NP233_g6165 [Leucocoprinus birnbaumii]|uniref:Uncharacterized protein n=1 Tax=Leucocoprinus birnbaumii TaxID=56174 RepID=A0AAD5VTT3_9AGAR|nr:hypothetical protein NP233_g6165 [Leucocoprinus birnbaumii]
MSQDKENRPPLQPIKATSTSSSAEEEEVSRSIRVDSHRSTSSVSETLYYIKVIAYHEAGKPPVEFEIDVGDDLSFSLYRDDTFRVYTGFPKVQYLLFDIDSGGWIDVTRRTKVDLLKDIKPYSPFFLVKEKMLEDKHCPGITHCIRSLLEQQDDLNTPVNDLPESVKSERDLSVLPSSPSPPHFTSPPFTTPPPHQPPRSPETQSEVNLEVNGDISENAPEETPSIMKFRVNTMNMNLTINRCSHKRPLVDEVCKLLVLSMILPEQTIGWISSPFKQEASLGVISAFKPLFQYLFGI